MRVLFDQGAPVPLAEFLVGHTVSTSAREGWSRYQNSDLLNAAEAAGFDVLVTTDKNLRYQQNLTVRKIAIIVLLKQQWPSRATTRVRLISITNSSAPGAAAAAARRGRAGVCRVLAGPRVRARGEALRAGAFHMEGMGSPACQRAQRRHESRGTRRWFALL
jgi:hypothetical protein